MFTALGIVFGLFILVLVVQAIRVSALRKPRVREYLQFLGMREGLTVEEIEKAMEYAEGDKLNFSTLPADFRTLHDRGWVKSDKRVTTAEPWKMIGAQAETEYRLTEEGNLEAFKDRKLDSALALLSLNPAKEAL